MARQGYLIWASVIYIVYCWALYVGYSSYDVTEVKNLPPTVRSNPGSYRDHYHRSYSRTSSSGSWFGGK